MKKNDLDFINTCLEGIIRTAELLTSGNFMHNKNSIKLMANIIKHKLEKISKDETE